MFGLQVASCTSTCYHDYQLIIFTNTVLRKNERPFVEDTCNLSNAQRYFSVIQMTFTGVTFQRIFTRKITIKICKITFMMWSSSKIVWKIHKGLTSYMHIYEQLYYTHCLIYIPVNIVQIVCLIKTCWY